MKNHFYFIFVIISFSFSSSKAQSWLQQENQESFTKSDLNFYEVQKRFYEYWNNKPENERETEENKDGEWQQFKRWEWFMEPRVYPSGNFDQGILVNEYTKNKAKYTEGKSFANRTPTTINWTYFGPNGTAPFYGGAGRLNCIAVDPNDSNVLYAGSASGGLWKSIDGGNSWLSNSDFLPSLGISDICIDPSNTNIIYIATGDKYAWATYSAGIMKSADGGLTWSSTGLNYSLAQNRILQKVIVSAANPNILLVASNLGIYRSVDGAVTWTNVNSGNFYDLRPNPLNPNVVFACNTTSVYRSNNGGITWSTLAANLCPGGRNSIAVTPADTNVLYTWCEGGIFKKSTNGGTTFSLMNSPNGVATPYGFYDQAIEVSPVNANIIYVGGSALGKSMDGGNSWVSIGNYLHGDNHDIKFLPGSNGSTIFLCNDGGLYNTTDGGSSWNYLNNSLDIKQYYRMGCSVLDPSLVYAGAQDNATDRLSSGSVNLIIDGDGTECLVDYTDNNIVYASYQNGNFFKSTDGGYTFNPINITTSSGNWVTPFVMHPTNPQILYAGYDDIYKSIDGGTSWNAISTNISNGTLLTSLVVSPSDPNYIYTATLDNIYKTTNGGANWTTVTNNLPINYAAISAIAVNDTNSNIVSVTFSGYSAGKKVYTTINGGATWTNISGTLPNIPANCIIYQKASPNALYIGTDLGVYYKDANMSNWVSYGNGLPHVVVNELEIQYSIGKLRAATYGRGIWESDIATSQVGIQQLNTDKLVSIYPNPAYDQLTILGLRDTSEGVNIKIYNMLGQKISESTLTGNKVDISNIKQGIYLIKINTSKGISVNTFIKQ